jgi:outer membrane protein assembly factor BamB
MAKLSRLRRATTLSLLAAGLAGCGGTITVGSSTPTPQGQPPGSINMPSEAPLTPPAGTTPGTLLAFDGKTGDPVWQSQAPLADLGQPVVADGMVFVQVGYGGSPIMLAAFNPRNGDLTWRTAIPLVCGETSMGSAILLIVSCMRTAGPPTMQALVHGLDPKTGRELWTAVGVAAAAGSGTVLLIVQSPSGDFKVRGLDPVTGQQLWEAKVTTTNIPPLMKGQVALVQQYGCPTSANPPDVTPSSCPGPGQARSFVSRLDPATGSQLWQAGFGQGGQLHRLLLGDVAVFSVDVETPPPPGQPPSAAPPPGAIGALDPATGTELWRQTVSTGLSLPALAVPGTVYVEQMTPSSAPRQCPTSRLDALDSKSGTLRWRLDNLQACGITVDADGHAVVLVLRTFSATKIVVLDAATGAELWEKPMATSGLYPLVHATLSGGVVFVAVSGHFVAPSPQY